MESDVNLYFQHREEIIADLELVWNYMHLHMPIKKSDVIIGCGCANKMIPVICADLWKKGYGKKIIFAGGLGKITKDYLKKSEAEGYYDIAIQEGVDKDSILLETTSTNTGDNFRFSLKLLENMDFPVKKILIVHGFLSERRTLLAAQVILKGYDLQITSPKISFSQFIERLESRPEDIYNYICTIVGDIQRLMIFPQLGWQEETEVPEDILQVYYHLKNMGFQKFLYASKDIDELIEKNGIKPGKEKVYFY